MSDFYKNLIISKDQIFKDQDAMKDADYGRALDTDRLAMHWIELPPHQKSSDPHAESLEEEFIYVVSGRPHVWVNGFIYQMEPGFCVGFHAGTGIAHTFINNTNETVQMIFLGDRTKKENKCSFPINPDLKEKHKDLWWDNYPQQDFGPHDASIGNLNHQKDYKDLSFIKDTSAFERKLGFSYPDDTEKFSLGVRLTDQVGLKFLGLWHEILKPQKRTSWPHAHKLEEEAAILIKGTATVWLNGFTYQMNVGDCVFFKPNTGIAHVIINDSTDDVIFLGIGEANDAGPDEKIMYPIHQTRNEQCIEHGYFWGDPPKNLEFGNHLGLPVRKNISFKKYENAADFLAATESLLLQKEAEYNLLLGICDMLKDDTNQENKYQYISTYQNSDLIAAIFIGPKSVVLTSLEEPIIKNVVNFIKEQNIHVPGVVGPSITSEAFARIWVSTANVSDKLNMGQKIYRLDTVNLINKSKGQLILADEFHVNLVSQWCNDFTAESLPNETVSIEKTIVMMTGRIKQKEIYIWLDENNNPVSMNSVGRSTKNGICISLVYTPKHLRGLGYASSLVAEASQAMLDLGKKFCVLYTNAANPTSNKIYQNIGYSEIAKSKHFIFSH